MHSSFFASLLALLLLATFSTARIVGITAPPSIKAGQPFTIILQTENFIQSCSDEYLMMGAHPSTSTTCATCLGTPLAYMDLRTQGHSDTGPGKFSESMTIASAGSYTITAAVTSVISGQVVVSFFETKTNPTQSIPLTDIACVLAWVHSGRKFKTPSFGEQLLILTNHLWGTGDEGWAQITKSHEVDVPEIESKDQGDSESTGVVETTFKVIELGSLLTRYFPVSSKTCVLLRDEYLTAYRDLRAMRDEFPHAGAVVTGQPGIGKTVFLYYLAIALIMEGESSALQVDHQFIYLVDGTVRTLDIKARGIAALTAYKWALADSNANLETPHSAFTSPTAECYVVQKIPPELGRWKGWKKGRNADLFVMKPFDWPEMYFLGTRIEVPPIKPDVLSEVFTLYGASARHCFYLARKEERRADFENRIVPTLKRIPNLAGLVQDMRSLQDTTSDVPPELFAIIPGPTRQIEVRIASHYIAKKIYDVLQSQGDAFDVPFV
ncbi:hypothetical protein FRB94_008080 [Tulasnella sp. JGI-2019a]|nr:hypothetical protein FRB94_008080 [Tulasnella sp. JGI-2019a]